MAVDTETILADADKLGQLVSQHPAVAKYRAAQKSVADDPDATRLLKDFDRLLEQEVPKERSPRPLAGVV